MTRSGEEIFKGVKTTTAYRITTKPLPSALKDASADNSPDTYSVKADSLT